MFTHVHDTYPIYKDVSNIDNARRVNNSIVVVSDIPTIFCLP